MEKLKNNRLQCFIDKLVDELKRGNREIDIPFTISTLYQNFANNEACYADFIRDITEYSDYGFTVSDSKNEYNGTIDVMIYLYRYVKEDETAYMDDYTNPGYDYELSFGIESRDWDYCQCTPDMPDYRADKHCCGHGCDASFSEFTLNKIINVTKGTWNGDEHDYWDFEDSFYKSDKESKDEKEKKELEVKIKRLKNTIEESKKELERLLG